MKVELIILQILQEEMGKLEFATDSLMEGISMFVSDNNLSSFGSDDDNKTKTILKMYLEPITSLPFQIVIPYFENYQIIKEFKLLSNQIFDLALRKAKDDKKTSLETISKVEVMVNDCIAKIFENASLKKWLEPEISETILDVDYLKGKTEALSIRLSRKVGKN